MKIKMASKIEEQVTKTFHCKTIVLVVNPAFDN